jgi:hypothetical protein
MASQRPAVQRPIHLSAKRRGLSLTYMYLLRLIGVLQGINAKKPFLHPAIIKTIQDFFFHHKRGGSIAQKHHSCFTSSVDTGAAADELEVPPAMVAMSAVAVSPLPPLFPLLTKPTRFKHAWTRRSRVKISVQTPTKILTTYSLHS